MLREYKVDISTVSELKKSLIEEDTGSNPFASGFSSRNNRLQKQIENAERRIGLINNCYENVELTIREWTIVDLRIEGWSFEKISNHILVKSKSTTRLIYNSACEKIANYINAMS